MHAEDREILRLAVPAFLALVAEPLFLLADSVIVGHLGTTELAGLGIAGAVLSTLVSLCVFLAYGTTAAVSRRIGAGDLREALTLGIDGIWLAVGIGVLTTAAGLASATTLVDVFDPSGPVATQALEYLRIALLGVIPLLVMLAATGILRGLQDTRTPLLVAVVGNVANVGLNVWFVYGLDLGIAGSAWGTLIAQVGSAVALVAVVLRAARRHRTPLLPRLGGIRGAGRDGVPLLLRTITLRASLLVMTYGATSFGDADLAAMQIAMTLWTFLAFGLDAIAIAAQALTGRFLGAGDLDRVRSVTRRMLRWGVWSGVLTGVGLAVLAPFVGALFTPDRAVQDLLWPVLLIAALGQPVAGVVFVLDGVLIGAGDGRYLAKAGLLVLVGFAPLAWLAITAGGTLVWLWAAFVVAFMGGRCVVLMARERTDAWMTVG
ncbi:MATE family efflux transporter [Nocardioides marmoriginsengisoli]|uniref:MATE family efflux transporter n=1 Tax=Nocardioides marmoriginsengisoli TaxID=661483 RepID=A0A3N0CCJ9_9ACTN|nr:MATE family efflux transporter [Nocardioides marmoriginsengisoli]RNL60713.1 MATE family efflux transporter [Nocardioides marmoriginsengisoli]